MQTATSRAVEVHKLSRTLGSTGTILPLSEGMLHQLLKSAMALEIDGTGGWRGGLCARVCNGWVALRYAEGHAGLPSACSYASWPAAWGMQP